MEQLMMERCNGATVEYLMVEQWNSGTSDDGTVEYLMVEQWKRDGGTLEHLMVEQWNI